MTHVYFAKQRTWFITIQLHPPQILQSRFTSIKLFFFYITAAALYPHSVPLTLNPHASYKGKALQVHNFIWCEDWPLQSFSCNQSHCKVFLFRFCIPVGFGTFFFFFLTELQIGFTSTFIHCRRQAPPSHFQTTEEIWHLEDGELQLSTV